MNRKELKKKAKVNLKKHYWLLVVVCIFLTLAVNGGNIGNTQVDSSYTSEDLVETGSDSIGAGIGAVYDNLAKGTPLLRGCGQSPPHQTRDDPHRRRR